MGGKLKASRYKNQNGDQGYPWHSRRGKLSRHIIIIVALALNACIAALALVVQWVDIIVTDSSLPKIGTMKATYSYRSLLAPGASLLGSINAFVSGAAIATLVTAYAKRRGLGQGISFNEIDLLSQLCEFLGEQSLSNLDINTTLEQLQEGYLWRSVATLWRVYCF